MSGYRLRQGGRIDRDRRLEFTFNGRPLYGYAGDTLASALIANGVDIVARSFKYRRPRGIVGAGAEEPNAILQLGEGARTLPVQRATQTELYYGLAARMVNCWPSADFDLSGALGWASRLLPAGFYYKTFKWPASYWKHYEHVIRAGAGLGHAPNDADADTYDKRNAHCDVLIVGAGPAGLAAALAAGRSSARVILADESSEFGGSLLGSNERLDDRPATAWVEGARAELAAMPEVTLLPRATVFGYYDHNFLTILERLTDHLPATQAQGPRQRLWRLRAKQVVVATGAIERPLVFGDNDRPGVMLASAVSTYVNRYAVAPGRRAVVFANNDNGYRTALDLHRAGVAVAAVVDSRRDVDGVWAQAVHSLGLNIMPGQVVVQARGRHRVTGARTALLAADGKSLAGEGPRLDCDLIAMSGGFSPVVHLQSQSGARPRFDETRACFVPGDPVQAERSAGAARGTWDTAGCLREGSEAGAAAAAACGFEMAVGAHPASTAVAETPLVPLWRVPGLKPVGRDAKQFVDYQNDTTAADIHLAIRENYTSIEHVKRYTALGFGTDQGKLGNINGMAIVAERLGKPLAAVGTTTFRPAYTPVTFGAIAGRDVGALLDATRYTPMHAWHVARGAVFENVGQWKRARYYPLPGETMQQAVERECLATHNAVGVLDYSTLGKIDIQGPDAAEFLDRVYTNNWQKLAVGRCRYGMMLGEDGMVMDDGVTARLGEQHYLMTTSTGNAAHVMAWLERWLQTEWPQLEVYLTSVTDHWATVSIAGPSSRDLVSEICAGIDFSAEAFAFMSIREGTAAGVPARVARVSFTGELSFEINVPAEHGRYLWDTVMAVGEKYGATPYGTETMHVLRAEKGFIIVGQDTDGSVTPADLGMAGLLSTKKDFIGRRSLARSYLQRDDRRQLVGLLTDDPAEVLPEGAQLIDSATYQTPVPMVGFVTSSYYSARVGRSIALALVEGGRERFDDAIFAPLAEGRVIAARICSPVFFDAQGSRQNVQSSPEPKSAEHDRRRRSAGAVDT
ncbi:sarcosine oxidase subunit alpha family protein [Salinisphaera aquimarina]|uniref:Sarcosine oxidase subunit alpha family protein n=1 Tax=Salinisphaera aquimarina TaxID=2094031 RepID=A0ABV7EUE2_9GAMM